MKKCLLLLVLTQLAWGQQFFIRNRPFQAVEKREGAWTARLPDLAQALGMPLTQAGQAWLLGDPNQEAGESGVYYQGKKLECVDTEFRVAVQAFLQEIGGRYVENKALGSVDLYAPSKLLGRAMTCNNIHLLVFHNGSANGQQVASFGDSFQTRGLEPVPVDMEDRTHPFWQQWGKYWVAGPLPYVLLVDPSGRILGKWNGSLPPQGQIKDLFSQFVSNRAAVNAQQVATPAGGGSYSMGGGG
ncbi:MAG: hypothetical protein U0931_28605 [Vulcanimicrobiota bacterium]